MIGIHADLLQRSALDQRDERVTGDLLGEPGAAGAEHAAFAVEQDLRGDRHRLGEGALGARVAGLARPLARAWFCRGTRRPCRRSGSRAGG